MTYVKSEIKLLGDPCSIRTIRERGSEKRLKLHSYPFELCIFTRVESHWHSRGKGMGKGKGKRFLMWIMELKYDMQKIVAKRTNPLPKRLAKIVDLI